MSTIHCVSRLHDEAPVLSWAPLLSGCSQWSQWHLCRATGFVEGSIVCWPGAGETPPWPLERFFRSFINCRSSLRFWLIDWKILKALGKDHSQIFMCKCAIPLRGDLPAIQFLTRWLYSYIASSWSGRCSSLSNIHGSLRVKMIKKCLILSLGFQCWGIPVWSSSRRANFAYATADWKLKMIILWSKMGTDWIRFNWFSFQNSDAHWTTTSMVYVFMLAAKLQRQGVLHSSAKWRPQHLIWSLSPTMEDCCWELWEPAQGIQGATNIKRIKSLLKSAGYKKVGNQPWS